MSVFRSRLKLPTGRMAARLRAARRSFVTEQREVLEAVGVKVLSLSKQDYVKKSRGGTGTDGIKWKPLDPETIQRKNKRAGSKGKRKTTKSGKARPGMKSSAIGINTGLQLNSASPGFSSAGGGNILRVTNTTVTVGYGRSYSRYFDAVRKLMPTKLPPVWRQECNALLRKWASKILKTAKG